VTLPQGRYQYDPAAHSLTNRKSGRSGDAASILSFDRDLDLDVGAAYIFATLAQVALWNGTGSQLASCPPSRRICFFGSSLVCVGSSVVSSAYRPPAFINYLN
jgi:hypothetical protein